MSNYKFKTTNIRGKQYVEVNERIKFFRQEEQYKNWTIMCDFPVIDADNCVCKCTIADNSGRVIATGMHMKSVAHPTSTRPASLRTARPLPWGEHLHFESASTLLLRPANEVEEAIAKQQAMVDNPKVQKLSKKLDAPVENIMDKAVGYIKSQTDKRRRSMRSPRSMVINSARSKWLDSRSSCDEHAGATDGAGGQAPPLLLLPQVRPRRHASLGDVHAGQLKKESEALYFGSLYDLLLFEPDKFNDLYYTLDDTDIVSSIGGRNPRSTKRYKEWVAEAGESAENANKKLAPTADVKRAKEMIQRLKDCGLYDKRFAGGKFQVEFNTDLDGVPLKGFLDCLRDGEFIVDSKSSRSIDKFRYDVNSFSYDIQAYIYTKVFGIKDFVAAAWKYLSVEET